MFGPEHYVPVLKGKKGEFDALAGLSAGVADRLTPLVEVPEVPWDYVKDEPGKSLDAHVDSAIEAFIRSWARRGRIFIQLLCADGGPDHGTGQHLFRHALDQVRANGVEAIPVVGPQHDNDYWMAAAAVSADHGSGVCLRVAGEELADQWHDAGVIDQHLELLGVTPEETDLVLDMAGLSTNPAQSALVAGTQVLSLPHITDWRTLTVVFSAFPETLSQAVPTNTVAAISRDDAVAWGRMTSRQLPRTPTFGDYGADNPEYIDVDPRYMKRTAAIRYTTDNAWLIVRGGALTGAGAPGFPQFHELARTLVDRPEYRGRAFSAGDAYIDDCARGDTGPGNQTTWRTVATSHHVTHVTDAIATTGGP